MATRTVDAYTHHPEKSVHPDTSDNPPGTRYYTSADTGDVRGMLSGPYDTYADADANVWRDAAWCERGNARAHWWSYGVTAIKDTSMQITPAFRDDGSMTGCGTCFRK